MRLWRFKRKAAKQWGRSGSEHLNKYLGALASMQVGTVRDTPMIAVDLELTGLDAATDHIIAIGWTQIDGGRIQIGSNRHVLVQADKTVGHSAVIHELVDSEVQEGQNIEIAMQQLLEAARGRVWLFHHAPLDTAFLRKACADYIGGQLPMSVLDTLQIEFGLRQRRDIPVQKTDLQLGSLRQHYKLPSYTAHNALIDAYATAELFLAMAAHLDSSAALKLRPYLSYT